MVYKPSGEGRLRRTRGPVLFGALLLSLLAAGGCAEHLPRIRGDVLRNRFPPIPEQAAPVLQWTGERQGLFTYWSRQDVRVAVRAFFPEGVTAPEAAAWEVDARNAEGVRLPFLGLVKRFQSEQGTPLAVLYPPVGLDQLPDGLYVALDPQVSVKDNRLESVRVTAVINEVRHHAFQPFRIRMPLIPDKATPLTPMPSLAPPPPAGTPIPVPAEGR